MLTTLTEMSLQCFRVQCLRLLTDYSRVWLKNGRVCVTDRSISSTAHLKKRKDKDAKHDSDSVDDDLKKAAQAVAESLPGDSHKTETDLLRQLLSPSASTSKPMEGETKSSEMSSILSSMKVKKGRDHDEIDTTTGRSQLPRFSRGPSPQDIKARLADVKLFSGPALGIFTKADMTAPRPQPEKGKSLWDEVEAEAIDRLALKPPDNAFEEMIQLTKEGKLWTFPIDNEAGMTLEKNTGFHEHIFLESHIRDFPKRGPIRHFMELVTVGLSKNPYLSVKQKHEHIEWFRNYFKGKQEVLQESLGKDGLMTPLSENELQ